MRKTRGRGIGGVGKRKKFVDILKRPPNIPDGLYPVTTRQKLKRMGSSLGNSIENKKGSHILSETRSNHELIIK